MTRRLGIEAPGRSRRRSGQQPVERICDSSAWLLSSGPEVETGAGLAEHLNGLLALLEPVTVPLWELAESGYEPARLCWIASRATEHAAELDRDALRRIIASPGDLWLDVCGDGMDDAE